MSEYLTPTFENRRTVLIIDDEVAMPLLYQQALRDAGYETQVIHRPEDALDRLCQTEPPSLVLLDFSLPRIPGPEFIVALLARCPVALGKTRILGFSSLAVHAKKSGSLGEHFWGCVDKPDLPEDIVGIVSRALAA